MSPQVNPTHIETVITSGVEEQRLLKTINTIVERLIGGEHARTTEENIRELIEQRVTKLSSAEIQREFYKEVNRAVSTFFGVEQSEKAIIMEEIRNLIGVVFSDIFEDTTNLLSLSGDRIRTIKDAIQNEIGRILQEINVGRFDVNNFIKTNIFTGGAEEMETSEVRRRFETVKEKIPEEIRISFDSLLQSFETKNKKTIGKKVIMDSLKKHTKRMKEGEEPDQVLRLRALLTFIESLKERVDVQDFHILDFLEEHVDKEAARKLTGAKENTLSEAVLVSRYNGRHLLDERYTQRLRKKAGAEASISAMSGADLEKTVVALMKIATKEITPEDINLRTGIGGSTDETPVRILSYVVSALSIARRFKKQYRRTPKVELFTGEEGAIACNGMNPETVRRNTKKIFGIVQKFVDEFFPDISESFEVTGDKNWSDPRMENMIGYLESVLIDEATRDEKLQGIIDELHRRGQKRGGDLGREKAVEYAAFHVICFRDHPTITKYTQGVADDRRHIISIGGTAEEDFDYVRDVLVEKFSANEFNRYLNQQGKPELKIEEEEESLGTRATVIASTGTTPPYFLATRGGDITLTEICNLERGAIERLLAERLEHALEITNDTHDEAVRGEAKSVLQSMAVIGSVAEPKRFAQFLEALSNEKSQ